MKRPKTTKLKTTKRSPLPPFTQICVSSTDAGDVLYALDTDGRTWANVSDVDISRGWTGWALVPDDLLGDK